MMPSARRVCRTTCPRILNEINKRIEDIEIYRVHPLYQLFVEDQWIKFLISFQINQVDQVRLI